MLYFANPCGADVEAAMSAGELGFIDTPAQRRKRTPGATWCADNGCFGKGYPGELKWFAWLQKHAADAPTCLFAVAPDVVGDAAATIARSVPWLPKIRELGYPAAFVGQDGLTLELVEPLWDLLDVFFIGGSTEWKLGAVAREIVAEAKARGKHVHMGRVNSGKRVRYARLIGCDSVDGTFLKFAPTENLGRLRKWFE